MWRILSLLVVPISMMAQTPSLSLLSIEEDSGRHVLQLRNLYSAPIVCYVVGYQVGQDRLRRWSKWDLLEHPGAAPLEAGATRDLQLGPHGDSLEANFWKPLAIIYADGTYAGSDALVESILEGREAVSRQVERGLAILAANPDAGPAVKQWFEETRQNRIARIRQPVSPGQVLPVMAMLSVPSYVRQQLSKGVTPGELMQMLKDWQARLEQYRLPIAFV